MAGSQCRFSRSRAASGPVVKILLTGVSSFTGAWFAKILAQAGHTVIATVRDAARNYEGVRKKRLDYVRDAGVNLIETCSFGDAKFIAALSDVDIICHHGAEVTNYHSLDFDVFGAIAANTANIKQVMEACAERGIRAFIASGSVFEQNEGLGEAPLKAFSPYGLSKGLSWEIQQFWAQRCGVPIGKFVIPNPFGPLEDARFCAYLMRTWAKGEVAEVRTPAYVRDNIPIDLLARAYADFVARCASTGNNHHCAPSGYVESQGAFAMRFAREVGDRLDLAAALVLLEQTEFVEPTIRINSDFCRHGWNEVAFWDTAAEYYQQTYCAE